MKNPWAKSNLIQDGKTPVAQGASGSKKSDGGQGNGDPEEVWGFLASSLIIA